MTTTKRLIEITKELESILPEGWCLYFPTTSKTGVTTIEFLPGHTPGVFRLWMHYFRAVLDKTSKYKWGQEMEKFRVKET